MKKYPSAIFPILLIGLLIGACTSGSNSAASLEIEPQIDSIFQAFDGDELPGAAVAVWHNGEIVFSKGYGSANLEYGIPVSPSETIFHVASVSKQFTVYAIKLLEAEGKLSLGDPIQDYISEVPDFGAPITLRHLATHTSGMRDQWSLLQMAGWRMDDVITVEHILKLVSRQQDLNFEPGSEYYYCNTGFTLLAETVARLSGKTFAEFTQERIFEPLGMEHTLFYDDHEKIVPNRAYSYYQEEETLKKGVLNFANAGATSLFTTPEDLVRWADHLNNPPNAEVKAIVEQMNTLAVLNDGETFGGAYGQFVDEYKGLNQISHGGADAGYRSYLGRFPDQDYAVAVVSNYANSGPGNLALQVTDLFLGDQMKEPQADGEENAPEEAPTITLEEEALKAFEGYYWIEDQKTYRQIYLKDGELMYSRAGNSENRLAPISANTFKMLDVGIYALVDFSGEEGQRVMTYSDPSGTNSAMPEFDYVEADAAALAPYTGTYYSPELDTSYELLIEEGELIARHNRLPDMEMSYLRDDNFSLSWYGAEFTRDGSGTVDGLKVSTGRVRDLMFEKQD